MKKNKLTLIFVIAFFAFNAGFAQTDSVRRNVTVVYSKVEYDRAAHNGSKDRGVKTLVKINPLLLINGDYPVYVERKIKDQLSVEGSVGATYTDYVYQVFSFLDTKFDNEDRRSKISYSMSGALKFYPSKYTKALDELYFGAEVRHRNYAMEVPDAARSTVSGYISESRKLTDFKFIMGYVYYISDRVILDYYAGIGLRQKYNSFAYDEYNSTTLTYETKLENIRKTTPVISAGIKIGFGL